MATKNTDKSTDVVARGGAEVAAALAAQTTTRDALVDPQPGDIIPDVESKGYHVGEVRQPAEPVLTRGGDVTFESLGDSGASKFPSTYAEDFAKLDEKLAGDPAYAGVEHVPYVADPAEADRLHAERQAARTTERRSTSRATGSGVGSDLNRDANATANAQAREDKG